MATVTKSDKSFIAALGPMKMEVIQVTNVTTLDTIESKLANPTFVHFLPVGDMGGAAWTGSATLSDKTITLRDPNVVTAGTVLVFGDSMA